MFSYIQSRFVIKRLRPSGALHLNVRYLKFAQKHSFFLSALCVICALLLLNGKMLVFQFSAFTSHFLAYRFLFQSSLLAASFQFQFFLYSVAFLSDSTLCAHQFTCQILKIIACSVLVSVRCYYFFHISVATAHKTNI